MMELSHIAKLSTFNLRILKRAIERELDKRTTGTHDGELTKQQIIDELERLKNELP